MGRGDGENDRDALIRTWREDQRHDHSVYLDHPYLEAAADQMGFDVSPRVLVAGDVHGELQQIHWLAARAKRESVSVIIQVGDLGYWPHTDPQFIKKSDKILAKAGLHMVALDGNHENFSALGCPHPEFDQFRVLGERVLHVPRGASWEWRGRKFLALGGAHSVDKAWRLTKERQARESHKRSHWLWWPEEDITDDDQRTAQEAGRAEILLTHDAPSSAKVPVFESGHREDPETVSNRQRLQRALESARSELVIHGHYHERYTGVCGSFDHAARIEGLGQNGMGDDSVIILDLEDDLPPAQ